MRVRHSRGVTLIELMVTIAVLAILAMLAAPSFADFFQRYRLRGAAEEVTSLVANARAEALMRNRNVGVVFSGTGENWCVGAVSTPDPAGGTLVPNAADCDCTTDPASSTCKLGERVTLVKGSEHDGVAVSSAASPATITFDRLTGAVAPLTGTTATMQSPNDKYSLQVQVTALGRALLCVPDGSPAMAGFKTCGASQ